MTLTKKESTGDEFKARAEHEPEDTARARLCRRLGWPVGLETFKSSEVSEGKLGTQSVTLDFLLDLGDVRMVLAVSYFHDGNGLGESKTRDS